jgi:hypothetical protein
LLRSSKTLEIAVENESFAEADLQLGHLPAERRPGQRREDVHDVAARPVRDRFKDVPSRAVHLRERDERATEIVSAAVVVLAILDPEFELT